jgi:hypothetical protein
MFFQSKGFSVRKKFHYASVVAAKVWGDIFTLLLGGNTIMELRHLDPPALALAAVCRRYWSVPDKLHNNYENHALVLHAR